MFKGLSADQNDIPLPRDIPTHISCDNADCLSESSKYLDQSYAAGMFECVMRVITLGIYGSAAIHPKHAQKSILVFLLGILKEFVKFISVSIEKNRLKMENFMISFSNKYRIKDSIDRWKIIYLNTAEKVNEYIPHPFQEGGMLDFSQSFGNSLHNAGFKIGQGLSEALFNVMKKHQPHIQRHVSTVQEEVLGLAGLAGNRVGAGLLEGTYRQLLLVTKNILLIATPLMVIIAFVKFVQRTFFEKNEVMILILNNF